MATYGEMFDEMLDEAGPIEMAGVTLYPSDILKECDPTAWRCAFLDYADAMEWGDVGEDDEPTDEEEEE